MKKKTISSAMLTVLLSSTMLPTITAAQEMTTSSTTENAITSSEVVAEDKEEEKEEEGKHTSTVSSAPREDVVGEVVDKEVQKLKTDAIKRLNQLVDEKLIDPVTETIEHINQIAEDDYDAAKTEIDGLVKQAEEAALTSLENRINTALAELAEVPGVVESDIKQFQNKIEASLAKDAGVAVDELLIIEKDIQTTITNAKNDAEKDLATAKADAIAEIKKLENLGEEEVEGWINDIETAVDQEAVKAVTALANDVSNWRTAELAKLHKLENLADSEIKQFEQDIMNNVKKDLIEAVTADAAALSKLRTDAINDILRLEKLGKLAETDAKQFIDKIMQETEQKAIDEIIAAAEALQDIRNDAKADIDKLVKDGKLAEEDAKAYITKIEQTIEADVISGLVETAGIIDQLRQDAIDEINQLLENGKIAKEDAEQFIAKVEQAVEADVIAEITKAASEIQQVKKDALAEIDKLVEDGKLLKEDAEKYAEKIKDEIEADVIGDIVKAAKGLEDARNEIIKELEHLRDMGIIAEDEFEALVEKLKSSIETDILDAEMLIHLEAAKAKANLEIDALELVGAITPEQAEAYREEVKAATKPSEVAAVMAKISVHRDFKALNDAIAKAKLKDQYNYMPNSWTSFEIALRHAEEVSETEGSAKPATQIEINDAFDHLLLAELKLERVASTKAIDDLQAAIRVAHSKKEKDYTKESWADMQTVLGEAEAMLAKLDGNVDAFTEKEVNDMTRKLNLAMLSMKRVDGVGGITNKPHTPTKPAAFKPASKPAAASASTPSASAPSASAPKAAASSLPKTGEVTHSLMSAGLLALGMAGYFYMSRKRLEVSGDITDF